MLVRAGMCLTEVYPIVSLRQCWTKLFFNSLYNFELTTELPNLPNTSCETKIDFFTDPVQISGPAHYSMTQVNQGSLHPVTGETETWKRII